MSGDPADIVSFRFKPDLRRRIAAVCAARGLTRSEVIRDATERYLATLGTTELPVRRKPPATSAKASARR
jgi:predicted DNA-binding protein